MALRVSRRPAQGSPCSRFLERGECFRDVNADIQGPCQVASWNSRSQQLTWGLLWEMERSWEGAWAKTAASALPRNQQGLPSWDPAAQLRPFLSSGKLCGQEDAGQSSVPPSCLS